MKNEQAEMTINTFFRESTGEWVGEINYKSERYENFGIARYTGKTENEARNAAFAMASSVLMELTFDEEPQNMGFSILKSIYESHSNECTCEFCAEYESRTANNAMNSDQNSEA